MPRRRTPEKPPPNSFIASAARMTRDNIVKPKGGSLEWQDQAWYFHDAVGELRFAVTWVGNALSRVRLLIRRPGPDGDVEVTEGPAVDALAALFGGDTGQSQMMHSFGVHLSCPGECYLIGEVNEDGTETWGVFSTSEVKESAGVWKVERGDGKEKTLDEEMSTVIRLWRSHPRKWVEADSPVRACLPILREVEQLTKHVGAAIDSRLAGAGILAVPSEMTFSAQPTQQPGITADQVEVVNPGDALDPFLVALTEAMVAPIVDRSNPNAVVPIVIKAPGALIGNMKHLAFSTPLDEKALDLRSEGIRRLALGMDMPPEVLLGQADSNHWSAWQIDEAALKVHIEPLCELIAEALTHRWLWPALEGQGINPHTTGDFIGFDTTDLRLRPNRSSEAVELYDRLELGGVALRRETGFEEGDAPTPADLRSMLLLKVASAVTTPDMAAAALSALGANLTPVPSDVGSTTEAEAEPLPAPADEPDAIESRREPPADAASAYAAVLLSVAEPMVLRAIERANNRVNNRSKIRRPIPEASMNVAMRDAFDRRLVERCCDRLGVHPEPFFKAMERYTTVVLATGEPHVPEVLARLLAQVPRG